MIRRGSTRLIEMARCATRCARVLVLPRPGARNDEQRANRSACITGQAVLDAPPLFGIQLREVGQRHLDGRT